MEVPEAWRQLAREVVKKGRVVLLIGASDTGKTTLCQFLAGAALEGGLRTAYLDADVGQSVIGPPTTLGMALLEDAATPYDPDPTALYFVGATSPARHLLPVVAGLRRLLDEALRLGAEFAVVDTTGLVAGDVGFALKYYKVEALQPTDVVAIERGSEVEHILRALQVRLRPKVHVLLPSERVVRRDQAMRQNYRRERFRSYFQGASLTEVELGHCIVLNPSLPLSEDGGERLGGRLVGLIDERGFALGLGVLFGVGEGRAQVLTPVRGLERVRVLQVGSVTLEVAAQPLGRSEEASQR